MSELATVNKTTPFISKWGYVDESKDSCENPYRLNTSKIFETCNFSANTFVKSGDIFEYTHSMPYYVVDEEHLLFDCKYFDNPNQIEKDPNEYQYIVLDDIDGLTDKNLLSGEYNDMKAKWIAYFLTTDYDPFDKLFGDTSCTRYNSKRFNKKYSRFNFGNSITKSSTLFRGVKFEITELVGDKEVNTGKYNDYKFSFIYIPVVRSIKDNKYTIHFVKNDTYKFIVGMIFFDVEQLRIYTETGENFFNYLKFSKVYVYGGCVGLFKKFNEDKYDSLDSLDSSES